MLCAPYGACAKNKRCPHIVLVALATDWMGAIWVDECAISAQSTIIMLGVAVRGGQSMERGPICERVFMPIGGAVGRGMRYYRV